ncbi:MAG TPA: EF-hand domain-containing protein [Myxococcota bacterium]|nr:EF-hand domain-containing protein [Myxococcota bacterium]
MFKVRSALALMGMFALASASQAVAPAFNELDKDHDGMLTRAEAASVKGLDFAKADINKDGRLDRAEYEAAVG